MCVSSLIPYDNPMKSSRLREVKKPALGHTACWTELGREHSTQIPRSPTVFIWQRGRPSSLGSQPRGPQGTSLRSVPSLGHPKAKSPQGGSYPAPGQPGCAGGHLPRASSSDGQPLPALQRKPPVPCLPPPLAGLVALAWPPRVSLSSVEMGATTRLARKVAVCADRFHERLPERLVGLVLGTEAG